MHENTTAAIAFEYCEKEQFYQSCFVFIFIHKTKLFVYFRLHYSLFTLYSATSLCLLLTDKDTRFMKIVLLMFIAFLSKKRE